MLGPTVNIHRSPLAGRNFECYSEDPLLSGKTAAAFVRGAQSEGVATTVKHFAANDAEFERMTINSVVDERTLREITLVPFELAVREGGSLGIMTAYNRLNGVYCAEHEWLLADVLRGEWGFEGFVISDWYARGSSVGSVRAGLDLEMPGPGRVYGPALAEAVQNGEVDESLVDAAATRLLSVFDRLGALDDPPSEPAVDRPARAPRARARGRGRVDGAPEERRRRCCPSTRRRSPRSRWSGRTPSRRASWAAGRRRSRRTTACHRSTRCRSASAPT